MTRAPAKRKSPRRAKSTSADKQIVIHDAIEMLIRQGRACEVADTIVGANGAATALSRLFTQKMMEWIVTRKAEEMSLGEAQIVHEMSVTLLEALAKVQAAAADVFAAGADAIPINGQAQGRAIGGEIYPPRKQSAVELFRAERRP